ncbi:amino acid permease [Hyphobacterium sp. CCMP332]|nr:amino acid permease [Hyphobacterium sp. CCMP332]
MSQTKKGFGTAPVFLTAVSTILGAIMFLRFGYAVGNVGLYGTFAIIIIGHLVTIPTAMAIAEIATNQKVEGGGEYYIISRSFGITIGAAIGIALYLSQAISVAFYIIAFSQAFEPVFHYLLQEYAIYVFDYRIVSIPFLLLLISLILIKGADLGVKALYFVVTILAASLIMFFMGGKTAGSVDFTEMDMMQTVSDPDNFFFVFAICFPAFTGMTAGVGLSGDLKDPKKSIPRGTLYATIFGMIMYFFIAIKLYLSASPNELDQNQLIMSDIAIWGPIIPIGLAAATISSALGSIMVAPRTLQALASDRIFPSTDANIWLSKFVTQSKEPRNAAIVTSIIAFFFVMIGDVNFVAEIISMFFMVTYGAICTISFLEHFAGDPSYRPSFRSKWFLSLVGAVLCIFLMFQMNATYATISLAIMVLTYLGISNTRSQKEGLNRIFQSVIFQLARQLQVFLQKAHKDPDADTWRPSVVCISEDSFKRFGAFELLGWISYKFGFGTYIHRIDGYLSKDTHIKARESLNKLIKMAEANKTNIYLDTMISPSYTSAVAQVIQLPGISGKENNMILFEFSKHKPDNLSDIVDNFQLTKSTNFDVMILGSSDRNFGFRKQIHIWLTQKDFENASLMILLSYIILGHPDWHKGDIKIFAIYPKEDLVNQRNKIMELIKTGRLPISPNNIEVIPKTEEIEIKNIVNEKSAEADLTILGIRTEMVKHEAEEVFKGYDSIGDVLFVNTNTQKQIV